MGLLSDAAVGLKAYHSVEDVTADIKSRNISALSASVSVLLALALPYLHAAGAKYGFTIDAETMGYVHDTLLGAAGLVLMRHLKSGPPVALVTGDGAAGNGAAGGDAHDPAPVGGVTADERKAGALWAARNRDASGP